MRFPRVESTLRWSKSTLLSVLLCGSWLLLRPTPLLLRSSSVRASTSSRHLWRCQTSGRQEEQWVRLGRGWGGRGGKISCHSCEWYRSLMLWGTQLFGLFFGSIFRSFSASELGPGSPRPRSSPPSRQCGPAPPHSGSTQAAARRSSTRSGQYGG